MKLEILPPDVNRSDYKFTPSDELVIFYGLGAIKGVGQSAIESIISSRKTEEYRSLDDFCERIDSSRSNRKLLEALIKAGAMDCFSDNRAALMAHLPYALQAAEQKQNNQDAGMMDIFAEIIEPEAVQPLPHCEPWDEKQRLVQEKEALGLFLTGHPLLIVEHEIKQIVSANLSQWLDRLNTGETQATSRFRQKEQQTTVCGLVVDIRMKNNFNGREAFVTLDDRSGRIDVRVSPSLLQEFEDLVQKDLIWVVEGGIAYDDFNNGIKLRASKLCLLDDYRSAKARALHIRLNGETDTEIDHLIAELSNYKSEKSIPLIFHLQNQGYDFELKTNTSTSISVTEQCLLSLGKHLKAEDFYLEY
ncbi:MAG: hypothetical protein GY770_29120 [Aestuariibacter sp.]|nr:hypothetical protein [Aestuariibacter sp.]